MIRIKGLSREVYEELRGEGFPQCAPFEYNGIEDTCTIDLPQYAIIKFRNNMGCDIDIRGNKYALDDCDFKSIELS